MHQEDSFQFLPLEFPLPREDSGDYRGYGGHRRDEQVVIGRRSQQGLLLPLRKKIKEDADDKQRDREMNQHYMLRALREKYCFYVERMQRRSSLRDDFAGHLRMNRAEIRISSRFTEGEGKLFVGVQHFGLERLRIIRADDGVRNIVTVDPCNCCPHRLR